MSVYYEPQPLVAVSDHKTIEVQTVKLAEDIDPRKLPTELRMARPSAVPRDSSLPQADVVIVTGQPSTIRQRSWRASVVGLALLAALLLLLLARGVARRAHAVAPAPRAALPVAAATLALTAITAPPNPALAPTAAPVALAEPVAADSLSLPGASLAAPEPRAPKRVAPARAAAEPKSRTIAATPSTSSRELVAPSANKPKRAIY